MTEILIKSESETDLGVGCRPEERAVGDLISYGIINLNKPQGPTSHQVADYAKKIVGVPKAGHSGTLEE